jgi:streptogramin lyase
MTFLGRSTVHGIPGRKAMRLRQSHYTSLFLLPLGIVPRARSMGGRLRSRRSGRVSLALLVGLAATLIWAGQADATPSNTTPPAISGTLQEGQTLSTSTGSWSGTPPLTYTYQWQRCSFAVGSRGSGPGQLISPEGVAVDSHGDIWVSDTYQGRLEVFNERGEFLKTVGSEGSGPDQIGEPEGIGIDAKGDVWVADWTNDRVEEFDEKGEYLQQFGSEGSGDGQLMHPYGIAVDAKGDVWVTDVGNNRVEEFDEEGEYISQFGSTGSGSGQFELSFPGGLAFSSTENVWVTDTDNNRVEQFNEKGEYVSQFGSEGSGDGQFSRPGDVTLDPSGNVWVVDQGNGRVEEFSPAGEYERQFGSLGHDPGQLYWPTAAAVDSKGDVWVADTGNNRLDEFSEQGEVIEHKACADIAGATSQTYALTAPDVGWQLQATVTAYDEAGEASATSALSSVVEEAPYVEEEPGPPASGAPVSTSPPSITGPTLDGQTLSASAGSWEEPEPLSYAYQWQSCDTLGEDCLNISGATNSTYPLVDDDVGTSMRVIVTATDAGGSTVSTSPISAAVAAVADTSAPIITGSADDGETLSASVGTWEGPPPLSYGYQWQHCNSSGSECTNISAATSSSYLLGHDDVGTTLRLVVTATNSAGSASGTSVATAVVAPLGPSSTTPPAITGTAKDGQTLTGSTGSWTGTPPLTYTYQWQSCSSLGEGCLNISGANASSFTLGPSNVAGTVRVVVAAENAAGALSATSPMSSVVAAAPPINSVAPAIAGSAVQEGTLSASVGSWSGSPPFSYTYQWQNCLSAGHCTSVEGATASTYSPVAADVGRRIQVVVTASDTDGSAEATSGQTVVVEASVGGSVCTDTWTGAAGGGSWSTHTNWSTDSTPVASDHACILTSGTVTVAGGEAHAGWVSDLGTLQITSGSLSINGTSTSTLNGLTVEGGALKGSSEVDVTGSFTGGDYGALEGSGSTVIESGATGTVTPTGGSSLYLEERTLNNAGTLTVAKGSGLQGGQHARLANSGTLIVNGETGDENHGLIGSEATLVNTGTVEKTEGTGSSPIGFVIDNEAVVKANVGQLEFDGGGDSGQLTPDTWSASPEASIALSGFNDVSYSLGESATITGRMVLESSVSAGTIEGMTADLTSDVGNLTLTGLSPTIINSLTLSEPDVSYAAQVVSVTSELEVSGSLTWSSNDAALGGPGTVVLGPGSTNAFNPSAWIHLEGGQFVNEGTLTWESGGIQAKPAGGTFFVNSGTFDVISDPRNPVMQGCSPAYTECPTFANDGTVTGTFGSGPILVSVDIANYGAFEGSHRVEPCEEVPLHSYSGFNMSASWDSEVSSCHLVASAQFVDEDSCSLIEAEPCTNNGESVNGEVVDEEEVPTDQEEVGEEGGSFEVVAELPSGSLAGFRASRDADKPQAKEPSLEADILHVYTPVHFRKIMVSAKGYGKLTGIAGFGPTFLYWKFVIGPSLQKIARGPVTEEATAYTLPRIRKINYHDDHIRPPDYEFHSTVSAIGKNQEYQLAINLSFPCEPEPGEGLGDKPCLIFIRHNFLLTER